MVTVKQKDELLRLVAESRGEDSMMEKNRGFSLVELLVATAILSVVMTIAMSFMMTGSRSFTKGSADATVQKEAELTVNQIEDMIIDLNGGVSMDDDSSKTELSMYHAEEDGSGAMVYSKSAVRWDKNDKNVYCSKWDVSYDAATGTFSDGAAKYADQLLAEHVKDFKVDLSDTLTTKAVDGTTKTIVKSVLVSVGYDDGTGIVDYATSPVITLRNRMLLEDNPANIFDEQKPAADTMKLHYSGAETGGSVVPIVDRVSEVTRGSGYNIYARISTNKPGDVNDLVDWVIEETGTLSTIDASGYLKVGEYEANAYLTITATYKSNPNKKATGVVKVVGGGALKSLESVHIIPQKLLPFAPQYDALPVTKGFTKAEEDAITYQWTVRVEGGGRELSDVAEPFADNNKMLSLTIKKDEANFDITLDITVEAYSDITGEKRTDRVKYQIPNNGAAEGDSNMERGKLVYDSTFFTMTDKGAADFMFAYCFCDEYGNPISSFSDIKGNIIPQWREYTSTPSEYDQWLKYVQLEPSDDWGVTYRLGFESSLPPLQEYYVMVQCKYSIYQNWDGFSDTWYRERIHYIPAVKIYGKTLYNADIENAPNPMTAWNPFVFVYTMEGFYGNIWADDKLAEYKIENLDFEAPEGVEVTPEVQQTTVSNLESNLMRAQGVWHVTCSGNQDLNVVKNQIKFKSLTIRVSLKDNPSINALVTIIFE